MAILKAFFDDSGDPNDGQCTVLTIGGFASDIEGWKYFEECWQGALHLAEVPYLHMKEFWNRDGLYKQIKADRFREIAFFASLIDSIQTSVHYCPVAMIRLQDLKDFNVRHGVSLDPYALAIYGCLIELRREYRDDEIDIVFDRFDRSVSRVALGLDYLRSDVGADFKVDLFTPIQLQKTESFRNVLPIQAADFIAWELRKYLEDRKDWVFPEKRDTRQAIVDSYRAFVEDHQARIGKPPRERASYVRLRKDIMSNPSGYVWDAAILEEAHARHPNGWV